MEKILVLGAGGQIGTDLVETLRKLYGDQQVIATDLKPASSAQDSSGPYRQLDATDSAALRKLVQEEQVSQVYHLVAMLSATAEKYPQKGWALNMDTLFAVLEMAREGLVRQVFWPSSIAAFGPTTPKTNTPQFTVMDPGTVYGISKLAGELWCQYYHEQYGVDVRSLRYPGIISHKTDPGGGTTDYAVEIFHKAAQQEHFTSFLGPDTSLPMMYMPDAIKATIDLMQAPAEQIRIRSSYNVGAFSFSPRELGKAVQNELPDFQWDYSPDHRDRIAQGWPQQIDDQYARDHWNWSPQYDLPAMVRDMLHHLRLRYQHS